MSFALEPKKKRQREDSNKKEEWVQRLGERRGVRELGLPRIKLPKGHTHKKSKT
jgi:hypothetical protein